MIFPGITWMKNSTILPLSKSILGDHPVRPGNVQMMASFWPTPEAIETDPITANLMNSWPKIVFSRTLHDAKWSNTRLVNGEAAEEVKRLKNQPGKDLIIFGSANLAASLIRAGLIDEYRI